MEETNNFNKFIKAQENCYIEAFKEIKQGKKTSHWMWFIFPQIYGLGSSETSRYYALKSIDEAAEYLSHPILGRRLIEITSELLNLPLSNPINIFGNIDSLKLKSSMTLFSLVKNTDPVFEKVLEKFFDGKKDLNTIEIIKN